MPMETNFDSDKNYFATILYLCAQPISSKHSGHDSKTFHKSSLFQEDMN